MKAAALALVLATVGACAASSPPPDPGPAPKAAPPRGQRCDQRGCVKREDCATGACPRGKTCVKTLLCDPFGEPDCDTYCLVVLR